MSMYTNWAMKTCLLKKMCILRHGFKRSRFNVFLVLVSTFCFTICKKGQDISFIVIGVLKTLDFHVSIKMKVSCF